MPIGPARAWPPDCAVSFFQGSIRAAAQPFGTCVPRYGPFCGGRDFLVDNSAAEAGQASCFVSLTAAAGWGSGDSRSERQLSERSEFPAILLAPEHRTDEGAVETKQVA